MVTPEQIKALLKLHGKVRPQLSTDWSGTFQIPPAIERFYLEVGPEEVTIDGYGNPYFLPSLTGLWKFQAGYRWNGLTGELTENWVDDWLVVANEGGNPFIFARSTGAILFALCGAGKWDPEEIFPDIYSMAGCLAQLGAIASEAGDDFTDDDCLIRAVYRERALTQLGELLGPDHNSEKTLATLGWS